MPCDAPVTNVTHGMSTHGLCLSLLSVESVNWVHDRLLPVWMDHDADISGHFSTYVAAVTFASTYNLKYLQFESRRFRTQPACCTCVAVRRFSKRIRFMYRILCING